jgi:hypothetical protein
MERLTWDDLLIQDITPEQFRDWISPWSGVITGRLAPAYLNKFGSWFLRRPERHVEMLDVFSGQVERVADNYDNFIQNTNDQRWQEIYLLSEWVYQLHQVGKVPGPGQCYSLAPHPIFGGPNPTTGAAVNPEYVLVTDVLVWQSICAQSLS